MEFIKRVIQSYTSIKNQGITGVTTLGGIYCGLHISSIIGDHLVALKIFGSFCSIVILPAFGVFFTDVYTIKIKPKIFKDKHKY